MKRLLVLALSLLVFAGGVAGCKSSGGSASGGSSSPAAAASPSASMDSCAQAGTRTMPKTRLLADLALTYGAFHRYLYKPFKAGKFKSGAQGRFSAILKAALATAAIVKLLDNAVKNARADPTLCKYVPSMESIKASLSSLAGKIRDGSASPADLGGASGLFDKLKNQTGFKIPSNVSLPGVG